MNFSSFDIKLLVTMATAIMLMTMVFPPLGLANDGVSASEVPSFEPDASTFNIGPDYPSDPQGPDSGTLVYKAPPNNIQDAESSAGDHSVWIHRETAGSGNTQRGAQLTWLAWGNTSTNPDMEITLFTVESDGTTTNTYAFDMAVNESMDIEENNWVVSVEFVDEYVDSEGYYTAELEFEVVERWDASAGGSGGFLASLADAVIWFSKVAYWFLAFIFEISVNLILLLFQTISFMFEFIYWMNSAYFGIALSGTSWASMIMLLPGIIMYLVLAKLVFIGISLLPTT